MPVVAVRKLIAVLALAVAVALLAAAPSPANTASARCTAFAVLKPGNEVRPPDTTDPVESRARGAALVRVNGTRLSFTVVIFNPARETFTAGHIHIGARGVNGPVVVPLFAGSSSRLVFTQSDALEIRADTAAAICANPAGYYVNYHTTQDPEGAVRGQLVRLF
jgi:CHRD domain